MCSFLAFSWYVSPLLTKARVFLGWRPSFSALRARRWKWPSYPESRDGTWSQVAAGQSCTHYIRLQRVAWQHRGPAEVLEMNPFCSFVHQPKKNTVYTWASTANNRKISSVEMRKLLLISLIVVHKCLCLVIKDKKIVFPQGSSLTFIHCSCGYIREKKYEAQGWHVRL